MSLLSLSPVTSRLSPVEPAAALDNKRLFHLIKQRKSSPVSPPVDVILTAAAAGNLPHVTDHWRENYIKYQIFINQRRTYRWDYFSCSGLLIVSSLWTPFWGYSFCNYAGLTKAFNFQQNTANIINQHNTDRVLVAGQKCVRLAVTVEQSWVSLFNNNSTVLTGHRPPFPGRA